MRGHDERKEKEEPLNIYIMTEMDFDAKREIHAGSNLSFSKQFAATYAY